MASQPKPACTAAAKRKYLPMKPAVGGMPPRESRKMTMANFLLSLGGIPPTAGFIGKYFLFAAAVQAGFGWLAIIAVLMSAVSMFYYLRLVVAMYLREGVEAEFAITPPLKIVAGVCLIVTLALGILPGRMIDKVIESSAHVAARAALTPHAGR
jgi:NADH:ubiquinone oxidoreductase subunit 2 (subunit N)